jgi:hypothetical protein
MSEGVVDCSTESALCCLLQEVGVVGVGGVHLEGKEEMDIQAAAASMERVVAQAAAAGMAIVWLDMVVLLVLEVA